MVEVLEKENIQSINDPYLKRATREDEDVVVHILCLSFEYDPHMSWLLEKCRNPEKLNIMMTYLFKKTLDVGEIYLSEDNQAVAMWKCEKR